MDMFGWQEARIVMDSGTTQFHPVAQNTAFNIAWALQFDDLQVNSNRRRMQKVSAKVFVCFYYYTKLLLSKLLYRELALAKFRLSIIQISSAVAGSQSYVWTELFAVRVVVAGWLNPPNAGQDVAVASMQLHGVVSSAAVSVCQSYKTKPRETAKSPIHGMILKWMTWKSTQNGFCNAEACHCACSPS